MGVWSRGPDPTRVDVAGIAAAMRPALYDWMTGHVQIVDLKRLTATDFDPFADQGGKAVPGLVLDSGANGALIQPIRSPTRIEVAGQGNAILGIRFQLRREPAVEQDQRLRGGLAVKVLDGGNDDQLSGLSFQLTEIVDSSLAWGRIFDAVVVTGG